jgi:hypothetical protein
MTSGRVDERRRESSLVREGWVSLAREIRSKRRSRAKGVVVMVAGRSASRLPDALFEEIKRWRALELASFQASLAQEMACGQSWTRCRSDVISMLVEKWSGALGTFSLERYPYIL